MGRKNLTKLIIAIAACLCVAGLAVTIFVWQPAIDPVGPPRPRSFDAALIARGATLAALGDCNTCHTAPGGPVFAGGLALPTPFGTVYSSNITPDPSTGIGRWSEAAFRRAMREGVDRAGRHLYPAFPYDHFTLVTDEDDHALYAYLMTRAPIEKTAPRTRLPFPLDLRMMVAGWNLLFLHAGPYQPDPAHDATWNRGAYLVEGLGHCGACHTPRNALGAEMKDHVFGGGDAEGWRAFTINSASQSPVPWDEAALFAYLRQGYHGLHGVARGPMAPVAGNLAGIDDGDLKAMATYVASLMGPAEAHRQAHAETLAASVKTTGPGTIPQSAGIQTVAPRTGQDQGAIIYAAACATCHESGRPVPYGGIGLQLSTAVSGETPRNLINIILNGLPAADGIKGPVMPGFAGAMTDGQLAALAAYLRGHFTDQPAWRDLPQSVGDARRAATGEQPVAPPPGTAAPAGPTPE